MTGFFIMVRGLSLISESVMARLTMGGSKSGRERDPFRGMMDATSSVAGATVVTGILASSPLGQMKTMVLTAGLRPAGRLAIGRRLTTGPT
jgi:hypothetical protein